jgi:hypothetical protein
MLICLLPILRMNFFFYKKRFGKKNFQCILKTILSRRRKKSFRLYKTVIYVGKVRTRIKPLKKIRIHDTAFTCTVRFFILDFHKYATESPMSQSSDA